MIDLVAMVQVRCGTWNDLGKIVLSGRDQYLGVQVSGLLRHWEQFVFIWLFVVVG